MTVVLYDKVVEQSWPKMRANIPRMLWSLVAIVAVLQIIVYYTKRSNVPTEICIEGVGTECKSVLQQDATVKQIKFDCNPGTPCQYPEEVAFRIVIMTFDRGLSLLKLLESLDHLELDGDSASLEIWLDRSKKDDSVNDKTLQVAKEFEWSKGKTRVNVHKKHVGLYGQWIDTWRAKPNSSEIILILEDDLTVSPYAYKWLKASHQTYGSRDDIAGYTLQSEGVNMANGNGPLKVPKEHNVFLYKLVGSWGFSPHPKQWSQFQDWYHQVSSTKFHPYVSKASLITGWYKNFEKKGTADNMWTMWFIYFCDKNTLFCVYNNLHTYTGSSQTLLIANRMEPGLHFNHKVKDHADNVLQTWSQDFVTFPSKPLSYDWDGATVKQN